MDAFKRWYRWIFDAPDVERLSAAIASLRTELVRRVGGEEPDSKDKGWESAAFRHLKTAEQQLEQRKLQAAWVAVKAAEREFLFDKNDAAGVAGAGKVLLNEAENIGGWRGKSIKALLTDAAGKPIAEADLQPSTAARAMALRDDFFDTQYFKIQLRRRHLRNISTFLALALIALLGLTCQGHIEIFKGKTDQLLTVILFGMLGATLSVAQALVASDLTAKITAQQVGAFLVWMRPMIGAAAAVVVYVLLLANTHFKLVHEEIVTNFSAIVVFALIAGFSERFIVGALNKVADAQSAEKKKN